MRHTSIKLNSPVEFVEVTPLNPLISKCQVKVCYVGQDANRNGSIITKDVALKMANSLPGSPIVGFFSNEAEDFEGHNQELVIDEDSVYFKSITQPYGFIDLGAKVWFQKFSDDGIEHEYLMTEGYLWTGRYPKETQGIMNQGKGQSMELDNDLTTGNWAINDKGSKEFFIINEAVISALCILGDDVEPCFEGSSITKMQFSFDEGFKTQLFEFMENIKNLLKEEGGTPVENIKDETLEITEETVVEETPAENFELEEEVVVEETVVEEEAPATEFEEQSPEVEEEPVITEEPVQYNLEEIQEYVELNQRYSVLETERNGLQEENTSLKAQLATLTEEADGLRAFKLQVERKNKEAMIASFYMLSEEDKADVTANIDNYSLDEIEAKLSIICVRNKVNFSLDEEDKNNTTFNLDVEELEDECVPAWVKAVQSVAKEMN